MGAAGKRYQESRMADHLTRLYERNPATDSFQYAGSRHDDDTLVEAGDIHDAKGIDDLGQDDVVDTLQEVRKNAHYREKDGTQKTAAAAIRCVNKRTERR